MYVYIYIVAPEQMSLQLLGSSRVQSLMFRMKIKTILYGHNAVIVTFSRPQYVLATIHDVFASSTNTCEPCCYGYDKMKKPSILKIESLQAKTNARPNYVDWNINYGPFRTRRYHYYRLANDRT